MNPAVYIPTLGGGERLARTLTALEAGTVPATLVVADNGEAEGCAALLSARFPEVRHVPMGRNLGFGPALNRAIAAVPGDPIVLLNDDATAEPGFLEALTEAAGRSGAKMAAAVLLMERDPGRIDSAGILADHTLMGFDYLNGEALAALDGAADPLGPTGGAALYDRAAFEAVGGFDERMFLYYEDLDLALRLRAAGATCSLAPSARAVHAYSHTSGARSAAKYEMTGWSRGYMLRRYGVMRRPAAAARALAAEATICAGQVARDRTVRGARGRIRGYAAGARLEPRRPPEDGLSDMTLREALALRRRRHGG